MGETIIEQLLSFTNAAGIGLLLLLVIAVLVVQLFGFTLGGEKVTVDKPVYNSTVVVVDRQGNPCTCAAVYQPVCGANGRTYFSSCFAQCDGVTVTRQGACEQSVVISNCGPAGWPNVLVGGGGAGQAGGAGAAGQPGAAGEPGANAAGNLPAPGEGECYTMTVCQGGSREDVCGPEEEQPPAGECAVLNGVCSGNQDCCAGLVCKIPQGGQVGNCAQGGTPPAQCLGIDSICTRDSDCCAGFACTSVGPNIRTCRQSCGGNQSCAPASNCTDSDNGDPYTFGITTGPVVPGALILEYPDICASTTWLTERQCIQDMVVGGAVQCEFGCANGACNRAQQCGQDGAVCETHADCCPGTLCIMHGAGLPYTCETIPSNCTETDNGRDPEHYGSITGNTYIGSPVANREDYCYVNDTLGEYFCDPSNGLLNLDDIVCPYGCSEGACNQQQCGGNDVTCQSDGECCAGFVCVIGTAQQGKRCKEMPSNCTETDGGRSPNVFGTTTGANCIGCSVETDADVCYNQNTVREFFCVGGVIPGITLDVSEDILCQYGCSNGACNAAPPAPACSETDGGNVPGVAGSATGKMTAGGSSQTYNDACKLDQYGYSTSALDEYYCDTGTSLVVKAESQCQYGCGNGACWPAPVCTDTDGGKVYGVKGTLTFISGGSTTQHADYCPYGNGTTTLTEYYCLPNNSGWALEDVICSGGGKCTGGKCG